jgi:hypothetical protein
MKMCTVINKSLADGEDEMVRNGDKESGEENKAIVDAIYFRTP